MSDQATLTAAKRERAGKGAARAERRDGRIPAVIYGDKKDPLSITLELRELQKELGKGGFSQRFMTSTSMAKPKKPCPGMCKCTL